MGPETKVAEAVLAMQAEMKAARGTLDNHCEQIRDIFYPEAASFVGKQTLGEKLHQKVYDSTGEQAGEILASGVQAITCNPSTTWLELSTGEPDLDALEDVALWLEKTRDDMLAICNAPSSGFVTNKHEQYMELVHFGTAPMFIGSKQGRPFFHSRPLAQCLVAENGDREVDRVLWCPSFTARQAVQLFGRDAGAKILADAANPQKAGTLYEFVHAVYPREQLTRGPLYRSNQMPFASCWVNVAEMHVARESGFEEFPYSCPRWRKRPMEAYGRSPAMKVLADCRMLQRAMRVQIRGVEKIVDPPWMVADDGVIGPLRVSPSGTNIVRGMTMRGTADPIRPLQSGGRPDLAEEFMNGIRTRIEQGFHVNLFQFARDPKMTATQFLGITEQTLQALAPVIGRLQVEDLGQTVDRLFGIMWRNGQIAPPPEAAQGRPLRVRYVSPIAKQQRVGEARAVGQWYEIMAPAIQLDPTVADLMDTDQAGRLVGEAIGLRKTLLRGDKALGEIRTKRQAAQEQLAQSEQIRATAETGAKVVQALPALREGLTPQTEVAGNA